MNLEYFNYNLPKQNIAIYPPKIRGKSKLLVLNKDTGQIKHRKYEDLIDFLNPKDTVILNNTKVIKARIIAKLNNKTREFLLIEKHGNVFNEHSWKVLYKGTIQVNEEYSVGTEKLQISEILKDGIAVVSSTISLLKLADIYGQVPLPPYLHRTSNANDVNRYQTEFASELGSVAAPTASLNFSSNLIKKLKKKHINVVYITLHVGLGTFLPIRTNDLSKHKMHSEYFEIPKATVKIIKNTPPNNKIVAIGTTVTRALEFSCEQILNQTAKSICGEADIFIYPGYSFKIVDSLLTNFHAPKSTVLMMASAFAGQNKLQKAYKSALENDYKFLSYGDSMLII